MYLVGAAHPNKHRAIAVLTQLIREGEQFITDVEVYQEILHRYTAIQRPDAIVAAFESLDGIVGRGSAIRHGGDTLCEGLARCRQRFILPGCIACGGDAESWGQTYIKL